jgi:hypothetical protein
MKNCPFCASGGDVLVKLSSPFDAGHEAWVSCQRCGARGPSLWDTQEGKARRDADAAWDKRLVRR